MSEDGTSVRLVGRDDGAQSARHTSRRQQLEADNTAHVAADRQDSPGGVVHLDDKVAVRARALPDLPSPIGEGTKHGAP